MSSHLLHHTVSLLYFKGILDTLKTRAEAIKFLAKGSEVDQFQHFVNRQDYEGVIIESSEGVNAGTHFAKDSLKENKAILDELTSQANLYSATSQLGTLITQMENRKVSMKKKHLTYRISTLNKEQKILKEGMQLLSLRRDAIRRELPAKVKAAIRAKHDAREAYLLAQRKAAVMQLIFSLTSIAASVGTFSNTVFPP